MREIWCSILCTFNGSGLHNCFYSIFFCYHDFFYSQSHIDTQPPLKVRGYWLASCFCLLKVHFLSCLFCGVNQLPLTTLLLQLNRFKKCNKCEWISNNSSR